MAVYVALQPLTEAGLRKSHKKAPAFADASTSPAVRTCMHREGRRGALCSLPSGAWGSCSAATCPLCQSRVLPQSASKLAASSLPGGAFLRPLQQFGASSRMGTSSGNPWLPPGGSCRPQATEGACGSSCCDQLHRVRCACFLQHPIHIQPIPLRGGGHKNMSVSVIPTPIAAHLPLLHSFFLYEFLPCAG